MRMTCDWRSSHPRAGRNDRRRGSATPAGSRPSSSRITGTTSHAMDLRNVEGPALGRTELRMVVTSIGYMCGPNTRGVESLRIEYKGVRGHRQLLSDEMERRPSRLQVGVNKPYRFSA